MNSLIIKSYHSAFKILSKALFSIVFVTLISNISNCQIENLPCQTEDVAVEDLERKDFEMPSGSTAIHSEGSMHNFTLPSADDYGPCKIISNITITIDAIGVDLSNLPPDCVPTPLPYYYNIALGCPDFTPASCPTTNLLGEPNTPTFTDQNLSYNGDFDFGENLSVDIVPVMNINCTNGQSALTSNSVILDYEICVTVTITDADSDLDVDLGADINVCPNETTTLDAGFFADSDYLWDPNGETTQMITTGIGNYTVTVTDAAGCTDTDDISILAFPEPNITFDPVDPSVCDNGMVSVGVNENYNAYNWSDSQTGQTVMLTTGTYDVTITDSNNCTAVNSIEVTNVEPPNAGIDNFLDVCDNGTTYNLDELLTMHDAGGTWTDDDGSGVDVNANPLAVSFENVAEGSYNFTYTVDGITPCPPDEAVITISVFEQNDVGTSATEQYCADPGTLDFYLLIGDPDQGGIWTDIDGSGVDLSNPFAVNMDGLPPATYNYEYLFTSNGPCPELSSTLTIIIIDGANAGMDNETTVCEGTQFDLNDLIDGANDSGFFEDTDGSGALSGSIVNTNGLAGQTFNFTFIVGSPASPCGQDEAIFTLNIDLSLSAGDDAFDTYCIGGTIDLFDILVNEDPGGTFVDVSPSGGLSGNILTTDNITAGTYIYQYQIGDGVTCPEDESEITLTFLEDPSSTFTTNNVVICEENCEDIQIDFTGAPPFNFPMEIYSATTDSLIVTTSINSDSTSYVFTTCNNDLGNTFVNDTLNLLTDSVWYAIIPTLTDANCFFDSGNDPDTLFLSTVSSINFSLDTFACITDTLDINGVQLFDGNSTYADTLSGMFCDSIVNINVTFLDIDTVPINEILCSGDSILIEGFWFNENFSTAEINVDNPNGCDSLLVVNVDFYPPAVSVINQTLCSGDSIVVNNTTYNESNPMGTEVLIGQSENGCDSTINIDLSFSDNVMILIIDTLCPNEFIQVAGSIYDETTPSGQVIISGAGCDTIIDINLSFRMPADTTINDIFCPDFSVNVNGTDYNSTNPTGVEIIPDGSQFGCDSTVTLDLIFYTPITSDFSTTLCESDFIEVNGTTYDISNPSGAEILVGASATGCDSTVNIDLNFFASATSNFSMSICDNESIDINGTIYDSSNTSGSEVISGGSTNGCDSTINVMIDVLQTYSNNNAEVLCEGDSIFLAGEWQFTDGTYVDSLQSVDMCDSIITNVITFMPCAFLVSTSTVDNDCAGGSSGEIRIDIESQINNTVEIIWTGANTGTSGSTTADNAANIVVIDNLPADVYTIQILDEDGSILFEQVISIIDLNTEIMGTWSVTNPIECEGETGTIEFLAIGGQIPYTYTWDPSTASNSEIATNIEAGDYALTVTDINGCTLTTSFTLEDALPFDANLAVMDVSCVGSNDGQITVFDIVGGEAPFEISINNQIADSTVISDLAAGTYVIEVVDANNCILTFTEDIMDGGNANFATYTENYTITQGESVVLDGTVEAGDFIFEWINNNQNLSCIDCPNPTASPTVTNIYELLITDEFGCTQAISILVNVEVIEIIDIAPNIFTPNGDNDNDEFRFLSNDPLTIGIELSIYDRWGNLIHNTQTTDNEVFWDGSRNGDNLVGGVYIYKLIIQKNDGTSEAKFGDVLLLR